MATNTSATSQNHNGTGSQANFAISFPFLLNSEIKVTVGGTLKTLGTHYNIVGSQVQFTSGNIPASGTANVVFTRDTNISTKRVDFEDGSVLTEADLDNNVNQVLFAQQEITNKLSGIEEGATADQTASEIKTLIASSPLDNSHLANNAVGTSQVADDAITAAKLANSINTEIANNTAKVTNATHTGDVTGSGSLTIAQDAVTTSKIAADAIVGAKIADNAINSEHYTDGSIDTEHIADDAVTAAKLANTSVTAGTYNTANITVDAQGRITSATAGTANVADGQITTAKLADDAVTTDKLANSIVSDITANNAKVTNVTTNLSTTTATGSVTVNSSDGTNATIGEATSSAAGVMSTAHHDKLDGIEANATADQTASEIKTLYESNSDTNEFSDAEQSKLAGIEASATADQTASEIKTLLQSDKLTASEIATGALDGRYYTETESDARYFNVSSGDTITSGDTFADNDTTIATTKAINARILDLVDNVGGFVPIANETSFPTSNPDAENGTGTIVSVSAASTNLVPSGTTVTIANGRGSGLAVVITGVSSTIPSGFGFLVETTTTAHTYTFHRLVPKATEVTTVATNATNIAAAGANTTNINTVAGNNSNINTVAGISGNVTTVAGISSNVTTVANNTSNINAVAADATDIGAVAGKATEIGRLGTADAVADLAILGTADVVSDMNTLATSAIVSDMDTLADISTNITTVAGISANVTTVAGNNSNITTVAGANSNISTVASSIANVNTTASNISNVNNFANTYQIASSNPSTDGGGNSLAAGDLYFNTSSNELRVYNGSSWQGGVTATGNLAALTTNTFTGQQTISNTAPKLLFTDTNENSDYSIVVNSGNFAIQDETNNAVRLSLQSDGDFEFNTKIEAKSGLDVTGNITVSGTVDGVDIAALNSTVSGITSNATHTGEVTGSGALTIADNVVDEANLKVSNSPTNGYFLQAQSGNTGGLTWAAVDLSSKFNTTGGTISGNVAINGDVKVYDDKVLAAGNSYDVYLYKAPSGGASYLRNTTEDLIISQQTNTDNIKFRVGSSEDKGWNINNAGHFLPMADSTYDLGLTGTRVRNVYADTYYGDGSNLTGISAGVTSDSQYNTLAGTNAGDAITSDGTNNTAFGYNAITDVTEGDNNTAIGFEAGLQANASTFKNTFIGASAGRNVTSGTRNTFVGFDAGRGHGAKSTSVGIGYNAAYGASESDIVCVGSGAGQYVSEGTVSVGAESGGNVSGVHQVFIGKSCGKDLTGNSSKNTLIGYSQFASNSGARDNNTGVGYGSAWKCQGDNNTFVGTETLTNAVGAANNTILGYQAGDLITTGDNNIVIGASADPSSATVSNEITLGDTNITKFRVPALGLEAEDGILSLKTGSGSVAEARFYCESSNAHYVAIKSPAHSAYSGNVSFVLPPNGGTNGYFLRTDGSGNTSWAEAGGASSLNDLSDASTDGGNQVYVGYQAGQNASNSVESNTYVGYQAGQNSYSNQSSVFVGYRAGRAAEGNSNVAIGQEALQNDSHARQTVAIGSGALYSYNDQTSNPYQGNTAVGRASLYFDTNGNHNAAFGRMSGYNVTTGDENVIVGALAGYGTDGTGALTTGSNNILIGYATLASSATVSNEITIGNSSHTKFRIPAVSFEITANAVTQGGVFYENATTVSSNYTVSNGRNAMAAGPITIASGVTVEVGADETLTIV